MKVIWLALLHGEDSHQMVDIQHGSLLWIECAAAWARLGCDCSPYARWSLGLAKEFAVFQSVTALLRRGYTSGSDGPTLVTWRKWPRKWIRCPQLGYADAAPR